MKTLILFLSLQLVVWSAHAKLDLDWSARKSGNKGIQFDLKKGGSSYTYFDKRDGVSGILWGYKKVKLVNYKAPLAIIIYGHGAKNYSLKIIDPNQVEGKRVLFSQSSTSAIPRYELIKGENGVTAIKVIYFVDKEPKEDDLFGNVANTEMEEVSWSPKQ